MAQAPFTCMLASPSKRIASTPEKALVLFDRKGWVAEPKWDGIRGLIVVRDGGIQIINRNGTDITYRYPDLGHLKSLPAGTVLDGEIVVLGENGMPDWPAAHLRDAQGSPRAARQLAELSPATFMSFDVLHTDEDVRPLPYWRRRELLVALGQAHGNLVVTLNGEGPAMWDTVTARKLEGMVAKHVDSNYTGARSTKWIKFKQVSTLTALVTGWRKGQGSRTSTIGSLELALWNPDTRAITPIGTVGTGFTDAELLRLAELLKTGTTVLVDVRYLDISPDGQLRQPVYVAQRTDLSPLQASTDQLKH